MQYFTRLKTHLNSRNNIKYFFRANPGIGKPERIAKFKAMMTPARRVDLFDNMKPALLVNLSLNKASDLTDAKLEYIFNTIIEVL
jgi:hypothetical protein